MTFEIIKRAVASYRVRGFRGFLKAVSIYALKRCKTSPSIGIVVRKRRFRRLMGEKPIRLHLGCGSVHLEGYVNIDKYSPVADRKMDAKKLDYPDNSVDEIFTSHMVEHLTYSEFMNALEEWRRVLKENGNLIIRCPNFERHLRDWLNADYEKRWGENNYGINSILGFQDRGPGYINRNLFTVERLKRLVEQAGFTILEAHTYPTRDLTMSHEKI